MALLTQTEFAADCRVTLAYISVYKKRGKIIVNEDGLVDTKVQQNADFLKKMQAEAESKQKAGKKKIEKVVQSPSEQQQPQPQPEPAKEKVEVDSDKTKQRDTLYRIEKEKKAAEVDNVKSRTQLAQIKLMKLNGELMPTNLVQQLFVKHTENIKNSYLTASENLLVIIGHKKELTATEQAELKKEFADIINAAINNQVDATKRELKHIIAEYSRKVGVGQHV